MTTAAETLARPARVGLASRAWRFVARHSLTVYALLAVAYLMLPIAIVILFSFNHPTGRFNYVWHKFTFDNWIHWNSVLGIQSALEKSLEIALLATFVATALGTLIALAIVSAGVRRTSWSSCRCRRRRSSWARRSWLSF